jgi:zinc D-Ala-D-Ala carboxypeptidase
MQLSKFFTLAEMTRSDTATRLGIQNLPDDAGLSSLRTLCATVLDPLREGTGAAIKVSSGYRGPELNARIGGAKKSQHMEGRAADIQSHGMSVLELFKAVIRLGLPYDQVIYEAKNRTSKWVHVSHDPGRARGAILVADFSADGKVLQYRTITAQQALDMTEAATRSAAPEELQYEEMADEPESSEADTAVERVETRVTRRPAKSKARPKTGVRKSVAAKRKKTPAKPGPKASKARKAAKRKTASKRVRPKAKKHK